jgi:pimeloyl-ACP methyl ester carboxylesterase
MPKVRANDIHLEYDSFGEPGAPPMLLIMGLGGQMILWPDDFCRDLARAGFHVVRFDNRDIGLSDKLHHAPRPRLIRAGVAMTLGLPVNAPYTLEHMADDAFGLMDALELPHAHVAGVSMGGMIAQIMAARHPQRIRSAALIMTTSGHRWLPQASLKIRMRLVKRPAALDRESLIRHSMETWKLIGSPGYPQDDATLRAKVERSYDRSVYPAGLARQTAAIMASGSRTRMLRNIICPTLIVHGAADPLVPVAAAHDLARRIPHAHLEIIPGMGHDLPPPLLGHLAKLIVDNARGGRARKAAADPRSKRA